MDNLLKMSGMNFGRILMRFFQVALNESVVEARI